MRTSSTPPSRVARPLFGPASSSVLAIARIALTYWPVRIDEGGEVLAPGNPQHSNQIIDQRDLTEWIVRLAENGTTGDFNGVGPGYRLTMGEMLEQIGTIATNPYELTWVTEDFLEAQGVRPWSDLPTWIPGDALMLVAFQSAVDAGLTYRPIPLTARDTLEWDKTRPAEERANRRSGWSRERERGGPRRLARRAG